MEWGAAAAHFLAYVYCGQPNGRLSQQLLSSLLFMLFVQFHIFFGLCLHLQASFVYYTVSQKSILAAKFVKFTA